MIHLPETVLQFGSGKFLRGFADLFIHQANEQGQNVGRVVVVQTTGEQRADLLNAQRGVYHVVVRGLSGGQRIDRIEDSRSISRALVATRQWPEVLERASAPEMRMVISNTAEAGYTLDPNDRLDSVPPRSFPAKLLLVLWERFRAGQPGVQLLPCELFEHNADLLLGIVTQLAESWHLPADFRDWLQRECAWRNTLVDRIVTATPVDHPSLKDDGLYVVAEPYSLWAVEVKEEKDPLFEHPALVKRKDVQPFFLRKVRILNAAHTAMVSKAKPKGIATVLAAMNDAEIASWLSRLLFEEIVPTVQDRVEDADGFALLTLERFRNPFLEHKVSDILTYHDAKVKIRLVPTRDEFVQKFGRVPLLLEEAIRWNSP